MDIVTLRDVLKVPYKKPTVVASYRPKLFKPITRPITKCMSNWLDFIDNEYTMNQPILKEYINK